MTKRSEQYKFLSFYFSMKKIEAVLSASILG